MAAYSLFILLALSSFVMREPAPYDVLAAIMLVGFLSTGVGVPREIRYGALLLGLFVFGNLLASALCPDPVATLRPIAIRTYMVMTWILLVSILANDPIRLVPYVWRGYLAAALVAITLGLMEFQGFGIFRDTDPLRVQATFKDPNVFGPFIIPVVVYALQRCCAHSWKHALLYAPVAAVLAVGVFLSFSRGAWLNLVISTTLFVIFSFVRERSYKRRLGWLLLAPTLALFATILLTVLASDPKVESMIARRGVLVQSYDLAEGGRFATQVLAIESIGAQPIGVGPGRTKGDLGRSPHNMYLQIFSEGGWIAGFGYLGFIALTLWVGIRCIRSPTELHEYHVVVMACLIGTLAQSLFIDATHWRHLWLLFALAWVPLIHAERSRLLSKSDSIAARDVRYLESLQQ